MRISVALLWILLWPASLLAHGGIPPEGINNYPPGLLAPPLPNRQPLCEETGANDDCGLRQSCLVNEATQPLPAGENVLRPGQAFEVPWLLSVVHGNGNLIAVRLRNEQSDTTELLIENFPQGDDGQTGEVIVIFPLAVPQSFPLGPAVIEVAVDVGEDTYYDCADLLISSGQEMIFLDGFE